jgi:flagellar basal body rod protein FlgC
MVASIGNATSSAVSGIVASEIQLNTAADNIANSQDGTPAPAAPFGASTVAAPLTGTQPSTATSQVFQALQAANTEQANGGVTSTVTNASDPNVNLTSSVLDFASARLSFEANAQTLRVANNIDKQTLNIIA